MSSGEEQMAPMSSGEEQMAPMSSGVDPRKPRIPLARAAVGVLAALALAGAPVGALWAWLAPSVHGVVALTRAGDRVHIYLGNEVDNFFVAACMLVGLLAVLAVVSAVAVWQWRAHRGPVMVAALCLGLVGAAGLAAGVGAALVHARYGTLDIASVPVTPANRLFYSVEAPPVFFGHLPWQIAATVLLPAALGAMVYALTAVSAPRDDLGAWPEEPMLRRFDPPVAALPQ